MITSESMHSFCRISHNARRVFLAALFLAALPSVLPAQIASNAAVLEFEGFKCNGSDRHVDFGFDFNQWLTQSFIMTAELGPSLAGSSPMVLLTSQGFAGAGVLIEIDPQLAVLTATVYVNGLPLSVSVPVPQTPQPFLFKWSVDEAGGTVFSSVYVDGALEGTAFSLGDISIGASALLLCKKLVIGREFYDGTVSDLRITPVS